MSTQIPDFSVQSYQTPQTNPPQMQDTAPTGGTQSTSFTEEFHAISNERGALLSSTSIDTGKLEKMVGQLGETAAGCCSQTLGDCKSFVKFGDQLHEMASLIKSDLKGPEGDAVINNVCKEMALKIREARNAEIEKILGSDAPTEVKQQLVSQVLLHSSSALAQLEVTSLFNGKLPFHNVLHTTEVGTLSAGLAAGMNLGIENQSLAKSDSLMLFAGMTHDIRMRGYQKPHDFSRQAGMEPKSSEGASFDRAMEILKQEQKGLMENPGVKELFSNPPQGEFVIKGGVGNMRKPTDEKLASRTISQSDHPMVSKEQIELLYYNIEGTVPSFGKTALNGSSIELLEGKHKTGEKVDQGKVNDETLKTAKYMLVGIADLGSSSSKEVAEGGKSWVKGQTAGNAAEAGFSIYFEGAGQILDDTDAKGDKAAQYLGFKFSQVGFANGRNDSMQLLYDTLRKVSKDSQVMLPSDASPSQKEVKKDQGECVKLLGNLDKFYFTEGKVSRANVTAMMKDCLESAGDLAVKDVELEDMYEGALSTLSMPRDPEKVKQIKLEVKYAATFNKLSMPGQFGPKIDPEKVKQNPQVIASIQQEFKDVMDERSGGVILTENTREGFKSQMESTVSYPWESVKS